MFVVFAVDACSPLSWNNSLEEAEYDVECRHNLANWRCECGRDVVDHEYVIVAAGDDMRCASPGRHCPFEYWWLCNAVTDPVSVDGYDAEIPF